MREYLEPIRTTRITKSLIFNRCYSYEPFHSLALRDLLKHTFALLQQEVVNFK